MVTRRNVSVFLSLVLLFALVLPAFNLTRAQAAKTLTLASGKGDIPSLDSALAEDTASHQVVALTHYTLVRDLEDKPGNIQPGVASKWTISDDGLTYTFNLHTDIPWVKWDAASNAVVEVKDASGKVMMVTAKDFEYGIKRLLDPRTASTYAYPFVDSLQIVGAAEFNGFKAPEGKQLTDPEMATELDKLRGGVAVKAVDDVTLEVKTKVKTGFGIYLFGMWLMAATPEAAIKEHGDKWTEPGNAMSYGPYVVSEWKHDESLTMVKNPFWPGLENSPKPTIDSVTFLMVDQTPAFSEYEAGKIDAVAVPLTEIDRVKADAVLSKELLIAPVFCTYYYGFNVTKAPFDDARVRRAFSMAVDRQDLIDNVLKGGQEPARWFARPGLVAAPTIQDSPDLGISFDAAAAKKELQGYLDEKGITADKMPPMTLMMNQVESHIKIGEALQAMWKENLGVDVQLTTQEWAVFLKTLDEDPPQIYRLGWCADYTDADNFLNGVFRSTSGNNHTKWASPDFDKLVDQAAVEPDVAKRLALYRQAEELLVKTDAAIIPIYWYTRVSLTKPNVVRTFASTDGDERFEKWDKK